MDSVANEELAGEVELLAAMWSEDELAVETLETGTKITVGLAPMTAGDEEKQFLWCELQLHVGPSYPSEPPELALGSSRGLSDSGRASLLTELSRQNEELSGEPALFALLEAGRMALTSLNTAGGECPICLGDLSDASTEQVLRTPCYHLFHRQCILDYCKSEISVQSARKIGTEAAEPSILCPECRAEVPWKSYDELQEILAEHASRQQRQHQEQQQQELLQQQLLHPDDQVDVKRIEDRTWSEQGQRARGRKQKSEDAVTGPSTRPEAFVRLHHLYQGNDEKEKPLVRLLKELGLDAVIFYGKPALLHIQGDPKDVESFAGTAKRRHITVTIDVAQRSTGPTIASGVTSVAAKKGSLNSAAFREHLDQRGLGETALTIIGS